MRHSNSTTLHALRNSLTFFCLPFSQLSYCFYEMAPSATIHAMSEHQTSAVQATTTANDPWNHQGNGKENQRPPVFFPEDYITALKKFSKHSGGNGSGSHKSIYDTIDETTKSAKTNSAADNNKSRTLPLSKNSEYK